MVVIDAQLNEVDALRKAGGALTGMIWSLGPAFTSKRLQSTFQLAAKWAPKPPLPPAADPRRPIIPLPPLPPHPHVVPWRQSILSRFSNSQATPGEDFFFVGQNYEPALNFGVADGVGGWAEQGADPSLFSQALMYHVDKISSQGKSEPADVLRRAYDALLNDDAVDVGSSTACILRVDASSGVLKTANLGDSGFCIYRAASASMFYISPAQTHYFNCPLQLSKVAAPGRNLSRNSIGDSPRQADVYETKLVDGDVVIAFTDGLSDNVFAAEIARICQMVFELQDPKASFAELIAYNLVHHARKRMFGNDPTPFEYEAKRKDRSYRDYTGGKIDDVTALVAIFKE